MEGEKRCHQVLGEIEHVQLGESINRIALLDVVSHHLRFPALTDRMDDSEKETLNRIFQEVGAEGFADVRLKRNIERQDYAYVLV